MDLVWALLGILSGMMIALQGPINAQLAQALGMPLAAAAAKGMPRACASCALMGPCSAIIMPDRMPSSAQTRSMRGVLLC